MLYDTSSLMKCVALRKESVDRNVNLRVVDGSTSSLSARRAWIEIVISAMTSQISVVALRKESVDRNKIKHPTNPKNRKSLSARRAWIEIGLFGVDTVSYQVALRKESVDRN